MAATDGELREAGVDPAAKRGEPPLGYIHSDQISVWVGIERIDGLISTSGAHIGPYRSWGKETLDGKPVFVNAERLIVIEL